ncbi:Uncharacterized mitochondrial protein AtMg00300 [Striga hermonthica]|uniref:Uncharacterized mitochondrial protein AtMg00300 n=1 Tax=Striga hermonthica TaxID=68872 RepID=A0A9N7NDM2_STRHE|nr:Uncharacterized mitochondrial protein AtMg00300 [Striga hermonthica]
MESYTAGDFGVVYLADNKPLKIVGKGDVQIKSANGSCWTLRDVRHIPGLKTNLISVGQLDNYGFHTMLGDRKWKVSRGAMTLARGLKSGTLYTASGSNSNILLAGAVSQSHLWHNRLGHMSEKGMKILKSRGLLPELESVDVGLYEQCVLGKQKREYPDDDKTMQAYVGLDISNTRIMRPADSVGAQIDEIERTEEEAEPESDEPIAESRTPLALGRDRG